MTTTFKKRQKEMKRQDKARAKAERRAQKKTDGTPGDTSLDNIAWDEGVGTPNSLRVPEFFDGPEDSSEPKGVRFPPAPAPLPVSVSARARRIPSRGCPSFFSSLPS